MNKDRVKKIFVLTVLVYALVVVSFYFLSGDKLRYKDSPNNITMLEADSVTNEITKGIAIEQSFINTVDRIDTIELVFTKFYRELNGELTIELYDENELLKKKTYDFNDIPEQHRVSFKCEGLEGLKGQKLTLKISSNTVSGSSLAAMMNKNDRRDGISMTYNKAKASGSICFALLGSDYIAVSQYYWLIVGTVGLLLSSALYITYKKYLNGKYNHIIVFLFAIDKYKFLIQQLVSRDFKSKYKRSVLGVFWSFLNPLLTMTVQFLVFSTFFAVDTQNYPVYLLTGVVFYSFFSECTTMCLSSISGNSNLITKVYVPKYIFPVSRTISSSINLFMSLIPLLLACLVLGVSFRPQFILFLYFVVCLIIFALGIGLFLSALMVFFRDIQFLWSVLLQIWMYATPIFYPAEIIPENYRFIVRFNPLYHFLGNARTCIMNGVSPEPMTYVICLAFALISLFIGAYTFKKTQDRFALYL